MRRLFLFSLVFSLCLPGGESYRFLFMSDMHFGESGSYARRADDPTKYVSKKDVFRSDRSRAVYQALFEAMAGERSGKLRFAIEGGDFVEGTFVDGAAHCIQIRKHWDWMCGILKCPVYPVLGNHDALGEGGKEAFRETLGAEIERLAGRPLSDGKYRYSFRQAEDLFIVLGYEDTWEGRLAFIEDAVRQSVNKPRHLFIVNHANVVQTVRSQGALSFLRGIRKYNPIVLCGHTHVTLLLEYADEVGKVTQFSIGTMLRPTPAACGYRTPQEDIVRFVRQQESLCALRKQSFELVKAEVAPHIQRVWLVPGHGAATLDVSDGGVILTLQSGDVSQSALQTRLR